MNDYKELIEEARDMTLYARTTKHGAVSHADMIDDLADALEASLAARQPSGDDREAAEAAATERWGTFANNDTRQGAFERDAFVEGYMARAAVPDAREHLHAKCDCVPDLGPAHCHLCTGEGSPVRWEDCEAVREIAEVSEPVEVVLTTADIEGLAHLLVQLSPATQKNSGATIRRLLREINIKEVGQ